MTWTLDFIMKGYFYGPTRKSGIITLANTNFYDATLSDDINDAVGNTPAIDQVTVMPGQLANGSPTSNASLSVDRNEITANSQYGYIVGIG